MPSVPLDDADIDVLAARHIEKQAEPLAVLRQIGDAVGDRVLGSIDRDALSPEHNLAALPSVGAVDQPREFSSPGTNQAGNPKHLAFMELEATGFDPSTAVGDVLDLEDDWTATAMRIMFLLVKLDRSRPTIILTSASALISGFVSVPT